VAGLPDAIAPQPTQAVLHTNRGDLAMTLDTDSSPCGVAAFAHLVRGGFWNGQHCYALSGGRFPVLDCGGSDGSGRRAGFSFPTEATTSTRYPAGTVVLTESGPYTDAGSIRVIYGRVPYLPSFTVLGQITSGLDVVRTVARAGTTDGSEYGPFGLPLSITGVNLR